MWAGLAFPCVYVLKDGVCLCVRVTVRLLGLFGPVMATHVPTKTSAEVSVSVRTDGAYSHTLSLCRLRRLGSSVPARCALESTTFPAKRCT